MKSDGLGFSVRLGWVFLLKGKNGTMRTKEFVGRSNTIPISSASVCIQLSLPGSRLISMHPCYLII